MKNENTTGTKKVVTAPQYISNNTIPQGSNRKTNYVNEQDRFMFDWIGRNLPDRKSFFVTDFDYFFRTMKNNCSMLVEQKKMMADVKTAQHVSLQVLNIALSRIHNEILPLVINGRITNQRFKYYGVHLLQFEKTNFSDGAVYWDKKEVTEQELINILSFNNDECCF